MRTAMLWAALAATGIGQSPPPRVTFLAYADARPAVETLRALLPDELRDSGGAAPAAWDRWVRKSDAEIRYRLARGDEDSLVNLLLFGTSFTTQPRITARQIEAIAIAFADASRSGAKLDAITQSRLEDFVYRAASSRDERLAFAKTTLETRGYLLATADGRSRAKAYLLHELGRVLQEIDSYARTIAQAEESSVPGAAFAVRSALYRDRGLSSDASIAPNFAIEEALKALRARNQLPSPIRRVAIVGPGLDFVDKQEGYDFYSPQTMQPFAVMDSLLRLGLSTRDGLQMATFDLSPRVNGHLAAARAALQNGQPYVIQLPLDAAEAWSPELLKYWSAFGDQIGSPAPNAAAPPNAGDVKIRAVRIAPRFGGALVPIDLNIVLQHLEVPESGKFDLLVGTNVFLYYSQLQQALAMANIERMIRPGGVLLSNNTLVDLPSSRIHYAGSTTVIYSQRSGDGDTIVWYKWTE